ncbi:MAG TPA: dTMP kinase [Candidatus Limnocylindria bacterium]|nr:dTMP kinase [Candidatus Limnocylindria bacterium]
MAVFITLEGPDGAGKSSQAALLGERLRAAGREVVLTREPGGTELGEQVRGVLLGGGPARDPLADALLFNAARRQLVDEVIRPALERGAVVICDRFADSTLAYQGVAGGAPLDQLRTLADIATGGLAPSRTVLFDLPVEAGLARRAAGPAGERNRFETDAVHDIDFHRRVREGFLALARAEPGRWRVVDAGRPPAAVAADAWQAVSDLFD